MPASSTASMKAPALPSMTGTSGPSISMVALSMASALRVAIRCSIVATEEPLTPTAVQSSVALTLE